MGHRKERLLRRILRRMKKMQLDTSRLATAIAELKTMSAGMKTVVTAMATRMHEIGSMAGDKEAIQAEINRLADEALAAKDDLVAAAREGTAAVEEDDDEAEAPVEPTPTDPPAGETET